MKDFYFSLIFGVAICAYVYSRFTSKRGIEGKQLMQMLTITLIISIIVAYSLLKLVLKI